MLSQTKARTFSKSKHGTTCGNAGSLCDSRSPVPGSVEELPGLENPLPSTPDSLDEGEKRRTARGFTSSKKGRFRPTFSRLRGMSLTTSSSSSTLSSLSLEAPIASSNTYSEPLRLDSAFDTFGRSMRANKDRKNIDARFGHAKTSSAEFAVSCASPTSGATALANVEQQFAESRRVSSEAVATTPGLLPHVLSKPAKPGRPQSPFDLSKTSEQSGVPAPVRSYTQPGSSRRQSHSGMSYFNEAHGVSCPSDNRSSPFLEPWLTNTRQAFLADSSNRAPKKPKRASHGGSLTNLSSRESYRDRASTALAAPGAICNRPPCKPPRTGSERLTRSQQDLSGPRVWRKYSLRNQDSPSAGEDFQPALGMPLASSAVDINRSQEGLELANRKGSTPAKPPRTTGLTTALSTKSPSPEGSVADLPNESSSMPVSCKLSESSSDVSISPSLLEEPSSATNWKLPHEAEAQLVLSEVISMTMQSLVEDLSGHAWAVPTSVNDAIQGLSWKKIAVVRCGDIQLHHSVLLHMRVKDSRPPIYLTAQVGSFLSLFFSWTEESR